MPLMSRLTCCNIGQFKTACLLWAYCETLKLIETLLPMNGLSYPDHRELTPIKTGAALMGAVIFVIINTIGFNIDHTVFVILPCFIVAHLIGYFTDVYCNVAWAIWSPIVSCLRHYH